MLDADAGECKYLDYEPSQVPKDEESQKLALEICKKQCRAKYKNKLMERYCKNGRVYKHPCVKQCEADYIESEPIICDNKCCSNP